MLILTVSLVAVHAFLLAETQYLWEDATYVKVMLAETAENRIEFRVFRSEAEARAWLLAEEGTAQSTSAPGDTD